MSVFEEDKEILMSLSGAMILGVEIVGDYAARLYLLDGRMVEVVGVSLQSEGYLCATEVHRSDCPVCVAEVEAAK